jgi:glycerophosphoryl diester phosphodiesterase
VCHDVGLELIAWTVDDAPRMQRLAAMGVDGICTNDPRLFDEL